MNIERDNIFREDHQLLRETARRFFEQECMPKQAQWDEEGKSDRETWLRAGAAGLLCASVPEEYGGGGGDFGHVAVIVEEFSRSGISGPGFGVHSDVVAPYIVRLGTEQQKRAWLPDACAGRKIFAMAMTEPGAGSDLQSIRARATLDGDDYVISGSKTFITNGLNADLILVVCKTDLAAGAKGISLFVVESDRAGFRRGRKLHKVGQPAADTAELFFDEVRVPAENMLGEENQGFTYMMQELAQERLVIALGAAVKLETLLEQTLEYLKQRPAFGKTIWDFQNTRFKIADIKAQALATRTLVDHYLRAHLQRKLTREEGAVAKLFSTESMWKGIDDMVQLHGGYGYMLEYPIARAFVDWRAARIYGGANEVMRDLIARKL
ncbi:acyl-CoA dehydrogenase family protein [Alcaligenaceae bacterium]|nr:acyl-CoA dehydrogenase family protein [Alcaligenaceae bacterium]